MGNTPKKKNTASLSKRSRAGPRRANQFQLARPTLSALEGCPVTGKPALTIISASRRTDIPAFYMRWFMNRLREGYAVYPNPFSGQIHEVSLTPEDVHSIVFWSKNFAPFLPHMAELDGRGYRYYGHFTITGAPRDLEPHTPPWQRSADVSRRGAHQPEPRPVAVDPILLTSETTPQDAADRFRHIARVRAVRVAATSALPRCTANSAALAEQGSIIDPPLAENGAVGGPVRHFRGIRHHLYAAVRCLLGDASTARCVDGDLLAELFPDRPLVSEARPTRGQCGCVAAAILAYDTAHWLLTATPPRSHGPHRLPAHAPDRPAAIAPPPIPKAAASSAPGNQETVEAKCDISMATIPRFSVTPRPTMTLARLSAEEVRSSIDRYGSVFLLVGVPGCAFNNDGDPYRMKSFAISRRSSRHQVVAFGTPFRTGGNVDEAYLQAMIDSAVGTRSPHSSRPRRQFPTPRASRCYVG